MTHQSRWPARGLAALLGWAAAAVASGANLGAAAIASQVQDCLLLSGGNLVFTDSGAAQAGQQAAGVGAHYQFSTRQLSQALAGCRKSIPGMGERPLGSAMPVALAVEATESPPAWSATDRLRLRYELSRELGQMIAAENRLGAGGAAPGPAGAQLVARLEFGGSQFSQRTLDQWVQPARRLDIQFSLESETGEFLAHRAVRVALSPSLRQVDDGSSTSAWFRKILQESGTAVRQLLGELSKVEVVYPVTRASDGTLTIRLAGTRERSTTLQLLLIPLTGDAFDSPWQTATADSSAPSAVGSEATSLKISDGDTRRCAEQPCVAWPMP